MEVARLPTEVKPLTKPIKPIPDKKTLAIKLARDAKRSAPLTSPLAVKLKIALKDKNASSPPDPPKSK